MGKTRRLNYNILDIELANHDIFTFKGSLVSFFDAIIECGSEVLLAAVDSGGPADWIYEILSICVEFSRLVFVCFGVIVVGGCTGGLLVVFVGFGVIVGGGVVVDLVFLNLVGGNGGGGCGGDLVGGWTTILLVVMVVAMILFGDSHRLIGCYWRLCW
ncbi:Hypothetical predicted protein [Olea europaea subsp. europaea]|uniref:Uncharacterized protein n=1 Tax=Olea europaea subsp. europaea TaxID=158383 RepID=A0A8S0U8U3_OLEEU|nr:Hypothetical predicted protein [Olea europaea subsp. europaea]